MKKLFIILILAISALSIVASEAEARRLGGGGSFGRQSQSLGRPSAQPSSQPSNMATPGSPGAAASQPKPASPWRNAIGGALLGLGLGALMSQLGLGSVLGSMIATILMIAVIGIVVMLLMRLFRRSTDYGDSSVYAGNPVRDMRDARREPTGSSSATGKAPPPAREEPPSTGIPANFDVAGFIRSAKAYFIRLQAAWDRADVNDIREFTTPEMFGELKMQLQERGITPNHTTILALEAELLEIETGNDAYLATVKFSGTIKEAEDAPAETFTEVWNLAKPVSGPGGWILAGIQQLA
jgi:predicted lipid-binding transport protein (Tim44 family)